MTRFNDKYTSVAAPAADAHLLALEKLETEGRLMETFSRLKGAMTLVIVTHRATLLPLADKMLDLSPGAETAAHKESMTIERGTEVWKPRIPA